MKHQARLCRGLLGLVLSLSGVACGSAEVLEEVALAPAPVPPAAAALEIVNVVPAEASVVDGRIVGRVVFSAALSPDSLACVTLHAVDGMALAVRRSVDATGTVLALRPEIDLPPGEYVVVAETCTTSADGAALASSFASGFSVVETDPGKYN